MCDGRCVLEAHLAATNAAPGQDGMDRRGFISSSTLAAVMAALYEATCDGAANRQTLTGSTPLGGGSGGDHDGGRDD